MKVLEKILDFIIYGNFWIAAAAMAMALQTQFLLFGDVALTPLLWFIFSGTILLYSTHRLISLGKAGPFREEGRFQATAVLQPLLIVIAGMAALAAAWFFFQLSFRLQLILLPAGLIALAYALPMIRGQRRLRDVHHLKIFLIAVAWSWITVVAVAAERHMATFLPAILITLERSFFIFSISLPFDLRDLKVDAYLNVDTLPARLGVRRTKVLAASTLSAMLLCGWLNFRGDAYSSGAMLALGISALISLLLIFFADRFRNDYYFSGLIDGTMVVQFLLVWGMG